MFQLMNIYYLVKAVECLQMITSTKWKESIPSRLSLNTKAPITSKKEVGLCITHSNIGRTGPWLTTGRPGARGLQAKVSHGGLAHCRVWTN